eukprot:TRINITY_DN175_c0_g2_i1.p1 TRINITY_DN175_c0_g2~~TRINITY_DN175_c0_g2_i1.p1  ORF type:complete len:306 (-),score=22.59 TRINITY_DN175_c0_g2_i1:222-1139(-)
MQKKTKICSQIVLYNVLINSQTLHSVIGYRDMVMQLSKFCMVVIICVCFLVQGVNGLSWRLYQNREDCVTEWVSEEQWQLLLDNLKAQGRSLDGVKTNIILSTGFLVVNQQGAVNHKGAVDVVVKTPNNEVLHEETGLQEKELELTTFGAQGPWQICFKINKVVGNRASVVLDLTYFTLNQRSLVGTAWEMNKMRAAADFGSGSKDGEDLMQQLVSRSVELADSKQVAELSRGIFDLDAMLMAVFREQKHIEHRTEAHLQMVQGIKSRMLWWSLFLSMVLIAASLFQVFAVRQLFKKHYGTILRI